MQTTIAQTLSMQHVETLSNGASAWIALGWKLTCRRYQFDGSCNVHALLFKRRVEVNSVLKNVACVGGKGRIWEPLGLVHVSLKGFGYVWLIVVDGFI